MALLEGSHSIQHVIHVYANTNAIVNDYVLTHTEYY